MKKDKASKISLRGKRLKAGWDNRYFLELIVYIGQYFDAFALKIKPVLLIKRLFCVIIYQIESAKRALLEVEIKMRKGLGQTAHRQQGFRREFLYGSGRHHDGLYCQ
ncbi:MAG: hypothetical protein LBO21_02975 [Synergistaceae bacterium]|nr:hypothetical protein [Synergistaceae bacterium]